MQIPCAYCKELGHHIRFCSILEAKNRNQQYPASNTHIPSSIIKVSITSSFPVRTTIAKQAKNTFAELYSSDDEVEEGEIVEEDRVRPSRVAIVSDYYSESSCEPPPPPPSKNDSAWTRSGIAVVQIPRCNPVVDSNSDNEEKPYANKTEMTAETIAELAKFSAYMEKIRGRSWVDIEYDSDLHYFSS
jgi:hypothetical protein